MKEVGSGASQRQLREKLLEAARRREIDVVLVWRLDRWGRSVADLLATLQELEHGRRFVVPVEKINEIPCATDVRRRFAPVLRLVPLVDLDRVEHDYISVRWSDGTRRADRTAVHDGPLGRPIAQKTGDGPPKLTIDNVAKFKVVG